MPDYTHVLLTPGEVISLESAVQYIKGGAPREIGVRFQSHFPLWQPGFTERRIRDEGDSSSWLRLCGAALPRFNAAANRATMA
jgi:hypothetical protein